MKTSHWIIIVFLQIGFVALGLWIYHLLLGGTGMDSGGAITLWAAVITIVFVVFSLIGMKNIDGKIDELEKSKNKMTDMFKGIESKSEELIRNLDDSRKKILKEAEKETNQIIRKSRDIQNYYQVLAMIESESNPERRAVMYTDLMAKPEPPEGIDKSYLYIKRGQCYMMLGLFDKAKADFDISLEQVNSSNNTNRSAAYASIADYYARKQDYEKSVEYYRKAVELNPLSLYYADLGNALCQTKAYEEADECYNKALAINPELAGVYYNKVMRMHEMIDKPTPADYTQMLSYIDKSISGNPLFIPAYTNKAAIMQKNGKEAEAADVLDQVLIQMLNDDAVMAIMQRGIANLVTNNYPKALNDFCMVLHYRPHNVQNICSLAFTYLEMGYLREADYYAKLGLNEAYKQNIHSFDGELFKVQQTVLALTKAPYNISATPKQPHQ